MIIPPNITEKERNRRLDRIKRLMVALLKNSNKKPAKAGEKKEKKIV